GRVLTDEEKAAIEELKKDLPAEDEIIDLNGQKDQDETKVEEKKTESQKPRENVAKSIMLKPSGELSLNNAADAMTVAQQFINGKMVPKGYETPQQVLAAFQIGAELGMKPMQALTCLAMINGNPSLHTDGPLALIMASGELEDIEEWLFDKDGCTLNAVQARLQPDRIFGAYSKLKRRGIATPSEWAYTRDEAEEAGLYIKPENRDFERKKKKKPWDLYFPVMCQRRARAFPAKTLFADILKGTKIAEYDFGIAPDLENPRDVTGSDTDISKKTSTKNEQSKGLSGLKDLKNRQGSKVVFKES
ncbi:MAG: hypothetical protein AB7H97_06320, partial [Pseudobdellovibrionaceae bacterium]